MSDKITLSDEEWRKRLSPEQYQMLRQAGTERAFTGKYDGNKAKGEYFCAGCGAVLLHAEAVLIRRGELLRDARPELAGHGQRGVRLMRHFVVETEPHAELNRVRIRPHSRDDFPQDARAIFNGLPDVLQDEIKLARAGRLLGVEDFSHVRLCDGVKVC